MDIVNELQSNDLPNEIWKDIPSAKGYQASNLGRIKSIDRTIQYVQQGQTKTIFVKGKIKKPSIRKRGGYLHLHLHVNNKDVYKTVHALVSEAFLGVRPFNLVVNHKELNNNINNLEYITTKKNVEHMYLQGYGIQGEKHHFAKLTEEQVIEIRKLQNSYSKKELANLFNISVSNIKCIIHYKTWKKNDTGVQE